MSVSSKLDDTVSRNGDLENSSTHSLGALENTDRLGVGEPDSFASYASGTVHKYAEGIIRFYRARTILEGGPEDGGMQCAWHYLECLAPHDLPASTRQHFLNLVYCMQPSASVALDAEEFEQRVRVVAELIDDYLDKLNAELDRAN